jgi:hypothetical protein
MKKKLQYKNKRKKTKSFLRNKRFWYGVFVLGLGVFVAYAAIFSPWLSVKEVRVKGENEAQKEEIVSFSEEYLWQSLWGIPTKSILFINTEILQEALKDAFPALSEIEVRRSFPQAFLVEVKEREQAASWCQGSSCFAIDEKGVPFKSAEHTKDMTEIRSSGSPEVILGREVIDPELLVSLFRLKESFQELDIISFDIESSTLARAGTKESWNIVFNPAENLSWQFTKLGVLLAQKILPEKRKLLEYIDLRFGDQAFVKYQGAD